MEAKGRILAVMNWNGGFRGILNSNFGNDVLFSEGGDNHKLAITDFDTFSMVTAPTNSSRDLLDPFVLQCLVEVVMGSLPIVQYIDLPPNGSDEEISDALGAVYFKKSSLWRSYFRHFLSEADAKGVSMAAVTEAIGRMRRTEAFSEILECRVLSSRSVKRPESERPFHYSHN